MQENVKKWVSTLSSGFSFWELKSHICFKSLGQDKISCPNYTFLNYWKDLKD
jgi:hypothetical protein